MAHADDLSTAPSSPLARGDIRLGNQHPTMTHRASKAAVSASILRRYRSGNPRLEVIGSKRPTLRCANANRSYPALLGDLGDRDRDVVPDPCGGKSGSVMKSESAQDKSLTPTEPVWMTKSQLATHLQCSPRTINNWMRRRVLPYVKLGRLVRFDRARCDGAMMALCRRSSFGG